MVTARDIHEAAAGLRGIARRTPLVYVAELGAHLKLENEQPIGAFKIRGAYNAMRKLPDAARQRGVITYSSGNHGQAVAYAAKQFGVRAVVTMPETAPPVKVEGVKKWGGEVVVAGRTSEDRRVKAEAIANRDGLTIVPPFDHADIVAGQATIALEIVEQLPDVERVVVPVGGGGLISGIVAGLAAVQSKAAVWGVEPIGAPKLQRSLAEGKVIRLDATRSIADGLITLNVGDIPFAELTRERERIRGVVLVDDDGIRAAVRYLWRTAKLAVEPSGAATTAALLAGLVPRARSTVLVVSGGNVDPTLLEAAD
ncbi:MAG: threonine ammonia-lyase [Burkholderiales bacterium]